MGKVLVNLVQDVIKRFKDLMYCAGMHCRRAMELAAIHFLIQQ